MSAVLGFTFAPFPTRRGELVIGLRVMGTGKWHRRAIRTAIRAFCSEWSEPTRGIVQPERNIRTAGGWLQDSRCFFVEKPCWPAVAHHIRATFPRHDIHFKKIRRPENVAHYARDPSRDQQWGFWRWRVSKRDRRKALREHTC